MIGLKSKQLSKGDAVFLALALTISCWLMWHTFSYDAENSRLIVSALNWGDFLVHIPFVRSFSVGANWPVEYPFFPGEPNRYHYLFYLVVGGLERLGLRLDWAMNLPSALGFFSLMVGIYAFALWLYRSRAVAWLSVVFFLANGSLAFLHFFAQRSPDKGIIAAFWQRTEWVAHGPYDGSEIAHFWNLNSFINQRHLAFALAYALLVNAIALWSEKRPLRSQQIAGLALGIGAGFFPWYHQPAFFVLAIIGLFYLLTLRGARRFLLAFGVTTLVTTAVLYPLLGSLVSNAGGAAHFRPGYLMKGSLTPWNIAWFWLQNLGVHFFLIPAGVWLSSPQQRRAYGPAGVVFVVAFLFQFGAQPVLNHKFFNFCLILGQTASAYALVRLAQVALDEYRHGRRFRWRGAGYAALGGLAIFLGTLSGVLDWMPIKNSYSVSVKDYMADEAGRWIQRNTPPRSVFLNATIDFNAASLTGRRVLLAHPMFAHDLNYDEPGRRGLASTAWGTTEVGHVCEALKKLNADYVFWEARPARDLLPHFDQNVFTARFEPQFQSSDGKAKIFETKRICASR